jgi:uncharacterized lipoprotein YddW (UPF0748 family)
MEAMKPTCLLLTLVAALCSCAPPAPAQEIRAFWADGFNEATKTPEQIDTLLGRLRAAHCNAIFAQVRKGGDAYYLSRYDPWASDDPEHFDALACLIEKAHSGSPRIAVHAWINTCAVGGGRGNPFHVAVAHPELLSLSDKGENYDNEAIKIDPGNPDAADWTFRVYLDVARHYDVDGIHFDFVRYGGANWGYNPVSIARFNARYGRTGRPLATDPLWKQWRRDQVTALVRKVYAMAAAVNPKIQVSAATITWGDGPRDMAYWNEKSAPMNRTFQDWRAWMEEGILDLNCQMAYYSEKKYPQWFRRWIDWGKDHQYRRWVVPGCGIWLNSIADSIRQVEAIRKPSKKGRRPKGGVLLYSYAGTNAGPDGKEQQYNEEFYSALSQPSQYAKRPPFEKPSEYPALPWKEHPKTGHLYGFVLNSANLEPADGATVTVTRTKGRRVRRAVTTDGTGFWAAIDLPPGNYTITVQTREGAVQKGGRWIARPGDSERWTGFLGASPVPGRSTYDVLTLPAQNVPVFIPDAVVLGGTDTFPGNLFVADGRGTPLRACLAQKPLLPFQPGDVVALLGTLRIVDGERVLDDAAARLVDIESFQEIPLSVSGRLLAGREAQLVGWRVVTVKGRVTAVKADRLLLDDDGVPMEVMLTGRKAPGVEAEEVAIPAPEAGSVVQVTGVVTITPREEGSPLIRLRPRKLTEVWTIRGPSSAWLKTGAEVAGALFFRSNRVAAVEPAARVARAAPRPR